MVHPSLGIVTLSKAPEVDGLSKGDVIPIELRYLAEDC